MTMHARASRLAAGPCPASGILRIRSRRMLVVEDDPDLRDVFEYVGAAVDPDLVLDWAENVPDAVRHMERERYDVVVSDYLLDESGSGLTLRHWCDSHRPRTRFAMMSAFPIGDVTSGSDLPTPFLPKPFTVAQLRRFLCTQLWAGAPTQRPASRAPGAPR